VRIRKTTSEKKADLRPGSHLVVFENVELSNARYFIPKRIEAFAATFAAFLALLGCLLVATALREPVPSTADEFSYSLTGEIFAEGRLSNPTPPLAGADKSIFPSVRITPGTV
jgi:hypothetical protein